MCISVIEIIVNNQGEKKNRQIDVNSFTKTIRISIFPNFFSLVYEYFKKIACFSRNCILPREPNCLQNNIGTLINAI